MRLRLLTATAAAVALSGCQQPQGAGANSASFDNEQDDTSRADNPLSTPDQAAPSDVAKEPANNSLASEPARQVSSDCPIISSKEWGAWIETEGEKNMLTVSGRVTLPSAGYRTSLVLGETREINPPGQTVKLVVTASTGPAAQVVTEKEILQQFDGLPAYSDVTIACGGETIGRIAKVVKTLG